MNAIESITLELGMTRETKNDDDGGKQRITTCTMKPSVEAESVVAIAWDAAMRKHARLLLHARGNSSSSSNSFLTQALEFVDDVKHVLQCVITPAFGLHFLATMNTGTQDELGALSRYGMCIRDDVFTPCFEQGYNSQRSADYEAWNRAGRTDPSADLQQQHQQANTVSKRVSTFGNILQVFQEVFRQPPGTITLCRSVRDGYVFLERWKEMEDGVIQSLKRLYGNIAITYDSKLWGGKGGWLARLFSADEN